MANVNIVNENSSVEDIAITLDELLCQKNEKDLINLLKTLNHYKTDMDNKSKHILRKIVEKFYDEFIDDEELSDDLKKERLLDICNKLKPSSNQASRHDDQKHKVPTMSYTNGNADETTDVTQQPIQAHGEGNLRSDLLREFGMLSPLRKELKIRGQIGEAGQKDKLTYVSLMHQIKQARLTGYTDQELINAVISSMVPGLTLRTVLETTPNLTPDRLTQFLEDHYEQKNAHDLCNTMTNMLQFPKESVYTFVMWCVEVHQKILLVSEKSCDLSYSPGFINKLFLRTIE